ncbi:MAG: sulfur carrier protein ThiS [Candidatus Dormibacteraeota bacterium]|nr:sulfur carrier protein ThiS [Candidatus Dormibacteraeota bacterium]MBV8300773.1 sulfur carrier protein ThiS [Candidatus Dormibacteraeota bacterium]MBV8444286.1 sulfur carrier protein ThiS [Candidatus Dormibacteraeota bacterium]
MNVQVNGEERRVIDSATVDDIVRLLMVQDARGIAVARNSEIVLRASWTTVRLEEGDHIEVLQAVQGG